MDNRSSETERKIFEDEGFLAMKIDREGHEP